MLESKVNLGKESRREEKGSGENRVGGSCCWLPRLNVKGLAEEDKWVIVDDENEAAFLV